MNSNRLWIYRNLNAKLTLFPSDFFLYGLFHLKMCIVFLFVANNRFRLNILSLESFANVRNYEDYSFFFQISNSIFLLDKIKKEKTDCLWIACGGSATSNKYFHKATIFVYRFKCKCTVFCSNRKFSLFRSFTAPIATKIVWLLLSVYSGEYRLF